MTRIVTATRIIDGVQEPAETLIDRMSRAPGDWTRSFLVLNRHVGWKRGPLSRWSLETRPVWVRLSEIVAIEETA